MTPNGEIHKIIVDELHRRVHPPESTVADNKMLKDQWISASVEKIDDLEDKIKFMEGIRVTKLRDTLQQHLNSDRIEQIFREYKKRGAYFLLSIKIELRKLNRYMVLNVE